MFRSIFYPFLAVLPLLFWAVDGPAFSHVIKEKDRTFIADRLEERWEVTQAESIGFKPKGFQYGLGRYAFTPLDDSTMSDDIDGIPQKLRIIGVSEDSEAKAYPISRLMAHEIANSSIGSKPIAVGF
jgi:hypothetical protein